MGDGKLLRGPGLTSWLRFPSTNLSLPRGRGRWRATGLTIVGRLPVKLFSNIEKIYPGHRAVTDTQMRVFRCQVIHRPWEHSGLMRAFRGQCCPEDINLGFFFNL